MTCSIFWQIFLLGLVGIALNQNLYFAGLADTSATFASATTNLIPVITFVMATAFRMEKVNIRSPRGQAKVMGTVICVGGAMIMAFYKGPTLTGTHYSLGTDEWLFGAVILFCSAVAWSAWLTFQSPVLKKYPAQKSLTGMMLLLGTVQSGVIGLIIEPHASAWKLKWDMELLSIVYAGVLCSAFAFFMQAYCIHEKGPVFAGVFNPLSTVLVAILDRVILHVKLHVGSLVGGILIISGLYIVLWGKAKDIKDSEPRKEGPRNESNGVNDNCSVDINQPLLNNGAHRSEEGVS
ncbi:WAT1-related protein At4g30420 isoform X2 [Cryptomeria japonica]|nr:WAT1-related protein At4g30420 isoform X2 [Cryptomeria japonica]